MKKCPDCFYWARLDIGLGYCKYTYRSQLFMTGNLTQSMQTAIIKSDNKTCDQWDEGERLLDEYP